MFLPFVHFTACLRFKLEALYGTKNWSPPERGSPSKCNRATVRLKVYGNPKRKTGGVHELRKYMKLDEPCEN